MTHGTVLVVDDDLDLRLTLADALTMAGFRVLGAANGREALDLLLGRQKRPDVILLDMMMPEMDGWAFRDEQRRHAAIARIPVVVFTAHSLPSDTVESLGVAGYLQKPAPLKELVRAVQGAACAPGASA
jgi:two-component system response regulator MprA